MKSLSWIHIIARIIFEFKIIVFEFEIEIKILNSYILSWTIHNVIITMTKLWSWIDNMMKSRQNSLIQSHFHCHIIGLSYSPWFMLLVSAWAILYSFKKSLSTRPVAAVRLGCEWQCSAASGAARLQQLPAMKAHSRAERTCGPFKHCCNPGHERHPK